MHLQHVVIKKGANKLLLIRMTSKAAVKSNKMRDSWFTLDP